MLTTDGYQPASVFGLLRDPVRDTTLGFGLIFAVTGLTGAALLTLLEWAWERRSHPNVLPGVKD